MVLIKILIVEDEILVAREIEDILQELGYQVVAIAPDGATTLQLLSETHPDLVLMDIVMPGELDGIAIATQIYDRFQIPVVYLTAYADDKTLERAKSSHPFGYILKPFNRNSLRATIEIALARHQRELGERSSVTHIRSSPFEYLSILSHELRNPISVIKLSTVLLGDGSYGVDEAKKQQLLQRIQSAIDCMDQLLEEVLTLGRAESDAILFNPSITNVVEFCQSLIEPLQLVTGKDHSIVFSHNPEQIFAEVDQRLLWHFLSNLLGNAVKYSPDSTFIFLRLTGRDEDVCFEVQDQGIGISLEDQEYLFEPFRRGKNVGKLPGTGLGLAIAKRVIDLHNGKISVESQLGHGTTFKVKLPLRQVQISV